MPSPAQQAQDLTALQDSVNQISEGLSKRMEWYAGFGVLITLVWIYLEILRLLSKLNKK